MGHTPGPWEIYEGNDESMRIATDERRICEMEIYIDNTDLANARLIAAAPELLEALKRLVDRTLAENTDGIKTPHSIAVCGAIKIARAAIAKAEGKA